MLHLLSVVYARALDDDRRQHALQVERVRASVLLVPDRKPAAS
jgi:hypothetical protein